MKKDEKIRLKKFTAHLGDPLRLSRIIFEQKQICVTNKVYDAWRYQTSDDKINRLILEKIQIRRSIPPLTSYRKNDTKVVTHCLTTHTTTPMMRLRGYRVFIHFQFNISNWLVRIWSEWARSLSAYMGKNRPAVSGVWRSDDRLYNYNYHLSMFLIQL